MTRRRLALLVVLLLAVLAGVAWLVLQPSGEPTVPVIPAPRDAAPAAAEASRASGPAGTAARTPRRHAPAETVAEETAEPVVAAPAPATRRFEVVVLGPGGRPVPGVLFRIPTEPRRPRRVTDGFGEVSFTAPLEGAVTVECRLLEDRPIPLTEPRTELHVTDLLPLDIRFVDLETGDPVVVLLPADNRFAISDEFDVELASDGEWVEELHEVTVQDAPIRAGRVADLTLEVEGTGEHVTPLPGGPGAVTRSGTISRYAERVSLTVPLPRELRVRVNVLTHDGHPAPSVSVAGTVTGSRARSWADRTDADGGSAIRGLPFLRGELVTLSASDPEGRSAVAQAVRLASVTEEIAVEITLPEHPDESIGLGGGVGGSFRHRIGTRGVREVGTSLLRVRVLRRDGRPANGARVHVKGPRSRTVRADVHGVATFDGMPAGTYSVRATEPGLVSTVTEIELADGETLDVDVHESEGSDARIVVLDAEGAPLPFALVTAQISGQPIHVEIRGGTQILELYTDGAGELQLAGLAAGTLQVTATFGSRHVSGSFDGPGPYTLTMPAK